MPDRIVEFKPRPRGKVTVKLAGGRFFTIPREAVSFTAGNVLQDDDIARLDRMDQHFRGKAKALRLISRRARTREEIKTALDKLSIESSIRNGIVSELEEKGLIDDLRFARDYVRVKREVRCLGPYRLRHDLKRLGVRKSIVDDVLSEAFDEMTQEAMARDLAGRRAGAAPTDEKEARRIADHLRRKGFDYEIVNRVVYELLRRTESGGAED
jgi:regulatory protein